MIPVRKPCNRPPTTAQCVTPSLRQSPLYRSDLPSKYGCLVARVSSTSLWHTNYGSSLAANVTLLDCVDLEHPWNRRPEPNEWLLDFIYHDPSLCAICARVLLVLFYVRIYDLDTIMSQRNQVLINLFYQPRASSWPSDPGNDISAGVVVATDATLAKTTTN